MLFTGIGIAYLEVMTKHEGEASMTHRTWILQLGTYIAASIFMLYPAVAAAVEITPAGIPSDEIHMGHCNSLDEATRTLTFEPHTPGEPVLMRAIPYGADDVMALARECVRQQSWTPFVLVFDPDNNVVALIEGTPDPLAVP